MYFCAGTLAGQISRWRWSCHGLTGWYSRSHILSSRRFWRSGQRLEVFIMFLKPFLNNVCSAAGHNILLKGDLTHTVSPNLMLILSTYRVVLHPSYLQKVFSFIIYKRKIQIYDSLRKKPSSWRRAVWAELKSDEHLRRSPTKQRHLMPFHLPSAVLNHDRDLL